MRTVKHLLRARRAVIAAVLLSLCFGVMGVLIRMMGESFDNFQQVYLRVLIAGLLALLVFRPKLSKGLLGSLSPKEWTIYGVRAMVVYIVGTASFTIAIRNADLGVVSFITLVPILGLLAFIMFREKLPLLSIPFLVLSTIGVFFLSGVSLGSFRFGVGEVAAMIAGVGANVGFLMSRLHQKQRNNYENTTILLLLAWIPVFLISQLLHESIIPQHVTLAALVGLVLSAVLNVVLLYLIQYVFAHLRAYVAGNILLLEGIWATLMGLLLYAEPVTSTIAIGALLIVVSAVAINKIDDRDEQAHVIPIEEPGKTG